MEKKSNYNPALHSYTSYKRGVSYEASLPIFNNLKWLTTREAAEYLRKSVNAIHLLVSRGHLRARKFKNRLYFNKEELDYLIETFKFKGG